MVKCAYLYNYMPAVTDINLRLQKPYHRTLYLKLFLIFQTSTDLSMDANILYLVIFSCCLTDG